MSLLRVLARDATKGGLALTAKKADWPAKYIFVIPFGISGGLGLYTAKQELFYAPDVRVKKSKRETLPELVEPDEVVQESEKFVRKSLFRKFAHLKGGPVEGGAVGQPVGWRARMESLKEVGLDPKEL